MHLDNKGNNMKKMQSYRIEEDIINKIDQIGKSERRSKSNVIEMAVEKYYKNLNGEDDMTERNSLYNRFYNLNIGELDEIYHMEKDNLERMIKSLEVADINIETDLKTLKEIVDRYI